MSATTLPRYEVTFRRLIEFLGDPEFDAITSNDVRRFLAWLPTAYRMGRRTVHDSWIPLSSLWTWAEAELGTPHIIRGRVKAPKYTERVIDALTPEEVQKLAANAGGARNRAIVLTLVDSGLRASELCAARVEDYDAGRIHVREGKGGKARFVVVGNRTQKAIWRYMAERNRPDGSEPLFATRTGRHIRRDNLRGILRRIAKRAGVPNVHPHRLRHTFAITYLRNGGNVIELRELLGHSSLTMVMRYARIAEQDILGSVKHSPVDNWRL